MNKFDTKCMTELILANMESGKASYIKNNDNNDLIIIDYIKHSESIKYTKSSEVGFEVIDINDNNYIRKLKF